MTHLAFSNSMSPVAKLLNALLVIGLSAVQAICTSGSVFASPSARSPLDLHHTVLNSGPRHLPEGLKRQKDCSDPRSPICSYRSPGVNFGVDKPTGVIALIELSRANGHFTQALPYGLTENSTKEDVRRVYRKLGYALYDENQHSLWSRGDIKIHGAANSLIYFDFDQTGRLIKAGLNGDLTTE